MKESMKNGMRVEQILASYDDAAPLTEASTIPAPWYVDARIAELERQTVFSRTWQVMGRVDQVEKPGQFVTATVAGEPLVAVRGNDGVLRAFYNVCRHHAAAGVTEPCWQSAMLHCSCQGRNYGRVRNMQSSPLVSSEQAAATSTARKGVRAWYFWQRPNFMLNCYEGYLDTNLVLPIDVDHCRVIFDFYFGDVSEAGRAYNERSVAVGSQVQDEELASCGAVQKRLEAAAYWGSRPSVTRGGAG